MPLLQCSLEEWGGVILVCFQCVINLLRIQYAEYKNVFIIQLSFIQGVISITTATTGSNK